MRLYCQTPYKRIIDKFVKAKKIGTKKSLSESLSYFCDTILYLVNNKPSYEDFSLFSKDQNMIFENKIKKTTKENLDIEIYSTGFINQILEQLNISNNKISEMISDAIFELHSELSKNSENTEKQIRNLVETINTLKNII